MGKTQNRQISRAWHILLLIWAVGAASYADPVGEKLVLGNASFDRNTPGLLTINQLSDRAIINWEDFSIGASDITRFLQPAARSAALNRVIGGNPSAIYGQLQANGQVFLINPAGILVGAGGQIDTAGFVASTLDLSNERFLKWPFREENSSSPTSTQGTSLMFSGKSKAAIRNYGGIRASQGSVYLIARTVENSGSISAGAGTVGLAGGSEVVLASGGSETIAVLYGNGGSVDNSGSIAAASAELKAAGGNMYALAINNSGVVRANSLVNEGGRIVLKAERGATVHTGTLESVGGEVQVLGEQVALNDNAVVDVSGASGGGTVLIGGGFQGTADGVANARRTFVGTGARIKANAEATGDGGKVVVWADELTRYYGSISARGGANGGDGGSVEVSGKVDLAFNGIVDVEATAGASGSVLLDPANLTIVSSGSDDSSLGSTGIGVDGPPDANTDATISSSAIEALTGNIALEASEDLTVGTSLTLSNQGSGETVELIAGGNLTINAAVTTSGASITFRASSATDASDASNASFENLSTASLTIGAPATGGALTFQNNGSGGILLGSSIPNSGKNVTFENKVRLTANSTVMGADVTFSNTVNGDSTANARELTVTASGTATFDGKVGGSGILGSLTSNGSGSTTIDTSSIKATTQEFGNAVTLAVTSTLTGTDVTFSSTVDGSTVATEGLTVNASGATVFRGALGNTTKLAALTTNASGTSEFDGGTASGTTLTFNDDTTLGANTTLTGTTILFNKKLNADLEANNRTLTIVSTGTTTFNKSVGLGADDSLNTSDDGGLGSITTDSGGTTVIKGVGVKADIQTYADGVEIGSDATLSAATATFSDTLKASGSGRDLTLNVSGTTTFSAAVGSTVFNSITTDSAGSLVVNTTSVKGTTMTFNDPLTIGANAVFTGTTAVFNNTVNGSTSDTYDMTVNATTTTFGSSAVVGATGILRSLITNSAGTTTINSGVINATTQTYSDDLVIGANTTFTGGTVSINDGVDGDGDNTRTVTVNANSVTTIGGTSGEGDTVLLSLTTDAAGSALLKGTIFATTQNYRDAVTVRSSSTLNLDDAAAGSVTFSDTVDAFTSGGQSLTINGTTTTFNSTIGATTKLRTLTTDSTGTLSIKGGAVTATTHNYSDALTVTADTTFTGTTVNFNGTLNADATANNRTLTVNASGVTKFGGVVGGTGEFLTMTTDSSGSTRIDTTAVTAQTSQTYNDTVRIDDDTTLTATTISFGKAVNADSTAQNRSLTVAATTTTFNNTVGTSTRLGALITDATGTTTLEKSVTATTQTYNDDVIVGANITLTGTGGTVTFASGKTLNSDSGETRNLTINTTTTQLNGTVGATDSLGTLATDSTGTTEIDGGAVTATTMDFNDAVEVGANLTLTATTVNFDGATIDSDTGQNRTLTINASGTTTIKSAVGVTDPLASLTTDLTGTLKFQGSVTSIGSVTIADAGDLFTLASHGLAEGDAVIFGTTVGNVVAGTEYYVIAAGLTANDFQVSTTPGGTVFDPAGSGTATGSTGQRIITTGAQTYNDPVTLQVNSPGVILRTGAGGSVTLASTVNANSSSADRDLTIASGGAKTFGGIVGGTTAVDTLAVGPAAATDGTVAINTSGITATTQLYNVPATIGATTQLTAATVTFDSTINGDSAANSRGLTITASGATTLSGAIGGTAGLGALITDSSGTLALDAGAVTATTQTYNDVVTLGANTTLTATDVTFASALDGAQSITATASGTVEFGGTVGDTTPLTSITSNTGGEVRFTAGAISVGGTITISDAGDLFSTASNHLLAAGDVVVFSGSGLPAGVVAGTKYYVRAAGLTATDFTASTTPGGGALDPAADGSGTAITGPKVATSGAQTYNDPVVIAAASPGLNVVSGGNLAFAQTVNADLALNDRGLVINGSGTVTFTGAVGDTDPLGSVTEVASTAFNVNGGSVDAGMQRYTGAVDIGADTTFRGTDIIFADTLDGAFDLTVRATGTASFSGAVGGTAEPVDFISDNGGTTSIGANIDTSGKQQFDDAVTLAASIFLTSSGDDDITFNSTVDAAAAATQSLTTSTQGTTKFAGAVGGTSSLSTLDTADGGGAAEITSISGGSITTGTTITFGDNLSLLANTTLTGSDVTFPGTAANSNANNFDLTLVLTGGETLANDFFNGTIRNLAVTDTGGITITGGATDAVTTTGKQTYSSAVTLATGNVTLVGTDITFAGTVAGGTLDLTVEGTGTTSFDGAVTGVDVLVTNAGGLTSIGADITTNDTQTYTDPLALTANSTLTTSNDDITLGAVVGGGKNLIVTSGAGSGDVTLGDIITDVAVLSVTAGTGTIAINGATVTTTGAQTYNDTATLGAATTLTSSGSGDITFGEALDNGQTLAINTSGATTFTGVVGGGTAVTSITTDSGGTTDFNANVTTSGAMTFNDAVTLSTGAIILASSGNAAITLASTVNGGQALTINTSGATTFGGAVGGGVPLASLTTNAGGTSVINGGAVTTTGTQTYGEATTIGADTTLTGTTMSFVTINGDGAGTRDLTLDFSDGDVVIAGTTVGNSDAILDLTSADAIHLTGTITTTGTQTYTGAVVLDAATTVAGTAITFSSTVDDTANSPLTVNASGVTTIGGAVDLGTGTFATDSAGTTVLNADITNTGGAINLNDAVTLGGNRTLTGAVTTGANGTIDATAAGGQSLTVIGAAVFRADIGGTFAPSTTSVSTTTSIAAGVDITTTSTQTYTGNVSLTGTGLVTLAGTTATFTTATVAGSGDDDLTLDFSGGTTTIGALWTGIRNLTLANETGGTTTITGSITTTADQTYKNNVLLTTGASVLTGVNLTFDAAIDNTQALTLTGSGVTTLNGTVGVGTALGAFTINGAGTAVINTANIDSAGAAQAYSTAMRLAVDTTFEASGVTTSGNGTINGTGNGTESLAITGNAVLGSDIGTAANRALEFVSVSGTSTLNSDVTTATAGGGTGNQTYTGVVTLGANNPTLTGGTPSFPDGIDAGANNDLTLNFSGTTAIVGDTWGDTSPIGALTVGGGGSTTINGTTALTTSGAQTYNDAVTLITANADLVTSNDAIAFNSTVNGGGFNLDLSPGAGINTTFAGALSNVGILTVDGTSTISGGSITSSGNQTYTGAVTLAAATTLTGATPTFTGGVVGNAKDLTLNFTGTHVMGTTFGSGTIANFAAGNGGSTTVGAVFTTTGAMTFNDALTLAANSTLTGTDITLGNLNGAFTLNTVGSGTTTFGGALTQVTGLTVSATAGSTTIRAPITTAGAQSYGRPVRLGNSTVINAGTAPITFEENITGANNNLTVTTSGETQFKKSITSVGSLTTGGGGAGKTTFGFSGDTSEVFVTTSGAQTYIDQIDAWSPTTLTGSTVTTLGGTQSPLAGNAQSPAASVSIEEVP